MIDNLSALVSITHNKQPTSHKPLWRANAGCAIGSRLLLPGYVSVPVG